LAERFRRKANKARGRPTGFLSKTKKQKDVRGRGLWRERVAAKDKSFSEEKEEGERKST